MVYLAAFEELAVKLAASNVSTKYIRLQLQFKRRRQIKVTVYNVPLQLNDYLSTYGSVQEVTQIKSADGTAHGDYVLNTCMDKEGFKAITQILTYKGLAYDDGRRGQAHTLLVLQIVRPPG